MGVVYRAQDPSGREVALKLVKLAGEARQERFRREAQILARFNHPGILRVHDFGEVGEQAWIATELLEDAVPLDAGFRERPLEARVELVAAVGSALGVVHAAGVVHRDVKPENLLLTRDGRVRVTDFGISLAHDQERLTQTGQLIGTIHYLSPEQAKGEREVGPPADVWALGVILYQAMTGSLPFEADSLIELIGRVTSGNFRSPRSHDASLPADLESICLRALSLEPEERYPDGAALGAALERWLEARAKGSAKSKVPALLVAGALLVGVAGALAFLGSGPAPQATPQLAPAVTPSAVEVVAPRPEPALDPAFLRDALPSELVQEARRREEAGHFASAGRCFAAAAAKRPRRGFHRDWVSGAALGDPDCVEACLRKLAGGSSKATDPILEAFERGAQAGRPAAVEAWGLVLCTLGSGALLDYTKGLALLERVKTPRALAVRGRLGRLGCGGLSTEEAIRLLEQAAAGGDASASRELALAVLSRPIAEVDAEEALRHLREAARGGDGLASRLLHEEKEARLPAADLTRRARSGDALSCLRVGASLRQGRMVPKHALGAHDWFRRATADPTVLGRALVDLSRLHAELDDPAGALAWARRARSPESLEGGGPEMEFSAIDVGTRAILPHLKGDDVHLEASLRELLARGRELGSPRVAVALGIIHDQGPRRDLAAACDAFAYGAELGQSDSQLSLARCLRDARGVERDYARAYQLARAAAEQGELSAFGFVIFATYRGEGVPADPAKALQIAREFRRDHPCDESDFTLGRILLASEDFAQRKEGLDLVRRSNKSSAKALVEALERRRTGIRTPLVVTPLTE
jgi:TPR repeat protein